MIDSNTSRKAQYESALGYVAFPESKKAFQDQWDCVSGYWNQAEGPTIAKYKNAGIKENNDLSWLKDILYVKKIHKFIMILKKEKPRKK